jgi:cathepsin B
MNRFLVLFALFVICIVVLDAATTKKPTSKPSGKPKKKFPPNGHKKLSPNQKKKLGHVEWRHHHHGRRSGAPVAIPDSFDARQQWPQCTSISTIRNQGQCGTCWAVSSASVISDRLCVSSNGAFNTMVSALQIATWTDPTQSPQDNCDAGGNAANAYKFTVLNGVCTGGEYGDKKTCQPYPVAPTAKIPLSISKSCTNTAYSKSLPQDLSSIQSFWNTDIGDSPSQDQIDANVQQMKLEIMTNGPITAAITCWTDFQNWTPDQAPYSTPSADAQNEGGHAIRVIGWGKSKVDGSPYWLIANSWGTDVGDQGTYQIAMGSNAIGIESSISAPIVKLPNTCTSFCDAPFDQIIRTNPSDLSSATYAFQGNCSVQVKVDANGQMSQVGQPTPIGLNFVGGPPGPITKWMLSGDQLWIMNPSGVAGECVPASGSSKLQCTGGTASSGAGAQTVVASSGNKYVYYNDAGKNTFMFVFESGSSQGSGSDIGTLITDNFQSVNALLDIDGSKMLVCGSDKSDNGACGVMSYDNFQVNYFK